MSLAGEVRTVAGAVPAELLGLTYGHEHLLARPPGELAREEPDLVLDDRSAALRELEDFRRAGGGALVEMTTVDYGRDLPGLRDLSERSGVHIVAATGFNKGVYCRPFCEGRDPAELSRGQVREIEGDGPPCGVVKFGTSLDAIEPWEEVAAHAAALTHLETGCPVLTHTEAGTMAHEQLDLLASAGVDPGAVVLSHMDRAPSLDLHLALVERGATLSYDQLPKPKYGTARGAISLVVELARRGLADRLLVGGDLSRRSYFRSHGGRPGLRWLAGPWRAALADALTKAGLDAAAVTDLLFVANPRRALAMRG